MEEKVEAQDTGAPVKKASTAEPDIDGPLLPDLPITTQPPRPGSVSGSSILSMSSVMSAIEMARETVENSSLESLSMEFQDRGDEVGAKYRYRIQWVCPFCFNEVRHQEIDPSAVNNTAPVIKVVRTGLVWYGCFITCLASR